MAKEIERKFLVVNFSYREKSTSKRICQGYICAEADRVVRVRIYGEKAFLTVKNVAIGFARDEFEYEIPMSDAEALLERCCLQPTIEKVRYKLFYKGFWWEIDEFYGENEGLAADVHWIPNVKRCEFCHDAASIHSTSSGARTRMEDTDIIRCESCHSGSQSSNRYHRKQIGRAHV